MMDNCYAVIMAGGRGQRFWPLSTSRRPKQVLSLVGDKPMIVVAVERLKGLIPPERTIVVTGIDHAEEIRKVLPQLPPKNIIGEPFARDTAAVCALASALVKAHSPHGAFCILTADHVIGDIAVFQKTIRQSFHMATSADALVTIGIAPTFPSTGFGYLEFGEHVNTAAGIEFFKAKRFVEKPDRTTAKKYLKTGRFCWNSGMFIWSVKTIQQALKMFRPRLLAMAERITAVAGTSRFKSRLAQEYEKVEKISIDYAVMEKAHNIIMAKGTFPWYDIGSWSTLADLVAHDPSNNVVIGKCEALDSEGNIVVSNDRLTALLGVTNVIVVQAGNATLVCAKDRAEEVKKLVELLSRKGGYADLL